MILTALSVGSEKYFVHQGAESNWALSSRAGVWKANGRAILPELGCTNSERPSLRKRLRPAPLSRDSPEPIRADPRMQGDKAMIDRKCISEATLFELEILVLFVYFPRSFDERISYVTCTFTTSIG